MKIIAWTTSFWNTEDEGVAAGSGLFGLIEWHKRVQFLFHPEHVFVACGTYSDPKYSPLTEYVSVVNTGLDYGPPYDIWYRQYWMCAATSAMAYALNRRDWDLMVFLDTDCLVGAVNFNQLLNEFVTRREIMVTCQWNGLPCGPFFAFKRQAACRFLHEKKHPGIIRENMTPKPPLGENIIAELYQGDWWNAWPEFPNVRQDYSVNPNDPEPMRSLYWPFIRQPHPAVIDEYQRTQWSKVVPL